MDLDPLLHGEPPRPFEPGARIPWGDPAFSARMLREHLSQEHDRASRRLPLVEGQVTWMHDVLLGARPGRVLDLGCGPGLHTSRLAARGHRCVGIDVSPAAIAHARQEAERDGLDCEYVRGDLREVDWGGDFDAISLWFGEFNTFAPGEAAKLLDALARALAPDGRAVLELHEPDYVRALGEEPRTWTAREAGLFADEPHLTLRESRWHPEQAATVERYVVYRAAGGPQVFAQTTQAYGDEDLDALFGDAGLVVEGRYESLTGDPDAAEDLFGVVLRAAEARG